MLQQNASVLHLQPLVPIHLVPRPLSESVLPPLGPEDQDVAKERERVKSGNAKNDLLVMNDLSKVRGRTWTVWQEAKCFVTVNAEMILICKI